MSTLGSTMLYACLPKSSSWLYSRCVPWPWCLRTKGPTRRVRCVDHQLNMQMRPCLLTKTSSSRLSTASVCTCSPTRVQRLLRLALCMRSTVTASGRSGGGPLSFQTTTTLRTRLLYSGDRYCATLRRSQCGRKPCAVEEVMTTVSLPRTSARWPWPISFCRSGLTPTTVRLSQRTSRFLVRASMVRKSPQRVLPHCASAAWELW
mmetsp:Transcript_66910/g.161557  ORF Transcript_66910/g.161557 Transcript_66910/m.161557 type:complete len:205 (-) Transcript_66910:1035-1649(-)